MDQLPARQEVARLDVASARATRTWIHERELSGSNAAFRSAKGRSFSEKDDNPKSIVPTPRTTGRSVPLIEGRRSIRIVAWLTNVKWESLAKPCEVCASANSAFNLEASLPLERWGSMAEDRDRLTKARRNKGSQRPRDLVKRHHQVLQVCI